MVTFLFEMSSWLDSLQRAQKICFVQNGRRKVHYKFESKDEMIEEYDETTNILLLRKWLRKHELGGSGKWEIEVGDPEIENDIQIYGIKESNSNPVFLRKDNKACFQWRIRNLPYSLSTYSISIDKDKRTITLRTQNKKYYKVFTIPDLHRLNLPLEENRLKLQHNNNTLVILYEKPKAVLDLEEHIHKELLKCQKTNKSECNPS